MISQTQLRSFPNATDNQKTNLKAWVRTGDYVIGGEEPQFINAADLRAPVSKTKTQFRELLDSLAFIMRRKVSPTDLFEQLARHDPC